MSKSEKPRTDDVIPIVPTLAPPGQELAREIAKRDAEQTSTQTKKATPKPKAEKAQLKELVRLTVKAIGASLSGDSAATKKAIDKLTTTAREYTDG